MEKFKLAVKIQELFVVECLETFKNNRALKFIDSSLQRCLQHTKYFLQKRSPATEE